MGIAYSIRSILGQHPAIFFSLYGMKEDSRIRSVQRDTDIVVEGFPRSANTFMTAAVHVSQSPQLNIAHHLHVPAQVTRGASLGIPVLVLIRHPRDAISSLLQYHPQLKMREALRDYLRFYKSVLQVKSDVVVSPFETTVTNYAQVIRTVNRHFQRDLTVPELSSEMNELIAKDVAKRDSRAGNASASRAASPQASRSQRKEELLLSYDAPELRRLTSCAADLYEQVLAETVVVQSEP